MCRPNHNPLFTQNLPKLRKRDGIVQFFDSNRWHVQKVVEKQNEKSHRLRGHSIISDFMNELVCGSHPFPISCTSPSPTVSSSVSFSKYLPLSPSVRLKKSNKNVTFFIGSLYSVHIRAPLPTLERIIFNYFSPEPSFLYKRNSNLRFVITCLLFPHPSAWSKIQNLFVRRKLYV